MIQKVLRSPEPKKVFRNDVYVDVCSAVGPTTQRSGPILIKNGMWLILPTYRDILKFINNWKCVSNSTKRNPQNYDFHKISYNDFYQTILVQV